MSQFVTVICICYNHERFVKEALDSVFSQNYPHIQVIIVDDYSSDNSVKAIKEQIRGRENVLFLKNERNMGNCVSFNSALAHARGEFVIDFATDDILAPDAVGKLAAMLAGQPAKVGAVFSDACIISGEGKIIKNHFKRDRSGNLLDRVPQGSVYREILRRYFINPAALMVRKKVLDDLGGYDESLAFEDFDLWVRSSRMYEFVFLNAVTVKKRVHPANLSRRMHEKKFQMSVYRTCQKAAWLNRNDPENDALAARIGYEQRQAFLTGHFNLVQKYDRLLSSIGKKSCLSAIFLILSRFRINFIPLLRVYRKVSGIT